MWQFKPLAATEVQKFYDVFSGDKTFLQSSPYGSLREALGESVFWRGIYQGETLIGIVLIQKITSRLKTFLHIPHGPLIEEVNDDFWPWFLEAYKTFGKAEKCDFVRIATLQSSNHDIFTQTDFRPAPVHLINPEKTWILDLTPDEETLLAQMKKSTRYEVRKGLKSELKVHQGRSTEDLEIFWQLHLETVKRQGFVPFSRTLTEAELKAFGDQAQIISIFHEGTPLASGVFLFDDRAGYYHQGASVYSKLPAAHAYLWQAILEAKRRGCREFNFWGVCDEAQTKHPWFGLSKFKRGFGGFERNYLHVHDAPITKKYWLNWAVEKYRRWKKGY